MGIEKDPSPDFFSVKQAAKYLRVASGTIYRACNNGQIRAFQIGNQWRISKEGLGEPKKCGD